MTYSDYKPPKGQWAIVGGKLVPLDEAALKALALNAMRLAA